MFGEKRAGSISAVSLLRVPALLAAMVLVWVATATGAANDAARAKASEAELKQVKARIESVRKSIQSDAERRDSLQGELKQADERIQNARSELSGIRTRLQSAEQQLDDLQRQQSVAQGKLDMERESLARELRLTYMNGRNEQLRLLLNQENPAQLGRMLNYYGYFGRARADHIASINEQLAHLELLKERIAGETDNLRRVASESERSAAALASARQQRARTLAQVETKLKSGTARLDKLQSDARSLERLLAELRRAMERAAQQAKSSGTTLSPGKAPTGRGSWPWPLKGDVLARFGQLRSGGPLKWEGLLIGATSGSQVRAPAAGRVLYSDW